MDMWCARNVDIVDPNWFYNNLFLIVVSITITSGGVGNQRSSSFYLPLTNIACHLQQVPYELDERSLLQSFIIHAGIVQPSTRTVNGHFRASSAAHLGWAVSSVFAFLASFAQANVFTSIRSRPMARASVFVVYINLYRLLLEKADDLCSFVLRSHHTNYRYCTRTSQTDLMLDCLRGLAMYHRVLEDLADLRLSFSPQLAELLGELRTNARKILMRGGVKRSFLEIHAAMMAARARNHSQGQEQHGTAVPPFEELVREYCPQDIPRIEFLSLAVSISSSDDQHLQPVSTSAVNEGDPIGNYLPFNVRDLLGDTQVADAGAIYLLPFSHSFDHSTAGMQQSPRTTSKPDAGQANFAGVGNEATQSAQGFLSISPSEDEGDLLSQQATVVAPANTERTPSNEAHLLYTWCTQSQVEGDLSVDAEQREITFESGDSV
jgi:hypothetical protein